MVQIEEDESETCCSCQGRRRSCCTVEKGTTAIGWINVILSTVAALVMTYWAVDTLNLNLHRRQWGYPSDSALLITIMILMTVYLILGIVAATFLLNGVAKKKKNYLTIWLVYAEVSLFVTILGIVVKSVRGRSTEENFVVAIVGGLWVIWQIFSIRTVLKFQDEFL